MIKNKEIRISKNDINSLITNLNSLSNKLNKIGDEVCEELATEGLDKLNTLYAQRVKDDNIVDISTSVKKTELGYNLISQGKDVIYEEFGTGDKGKESPHVEKSKYPQLHDYNSGKYIRPVSGDNPKLKAHGITSGKYWTYKKEGMSEVQFTQGVPAGMEMYKTRNYLKDDAEKNIFKKKASDVLSKL